MTTNRIFIPQQPVQPLTSTREQVKRSTEDRQGNFAQVLEQKLGSSLKFSQHARQRLQARNIEFSSADMEKLEQAVGKAREKGSRDSLILMNDLALLVSVKNNTVITAVDGQNLKENVFTNIDSAVIV